LSSLITAFS